MNFLTQISKVCLALSVAAFAVSAETENPVVALETAGDSVQLKVVKFDTSPPLRDIKVSKKADRPLKISREHDTPEGLNKLPEGWSGKKGSRFSPSISSCATTRGAAVGAAPRLPCSIART
ncbi:MAG: hypothetical protein DRJ61_03585 [Acidobacteria bacterium]|nr:MAG: hypothetical protein DRJ61_03585 [Acidobacteriota bacterium]